ncbi:MAG: hypothetical protein GX621_15530 [Pirellulaceae bacterium]|nr:hypothetical protein [Pirellulaceae bacterium]
MSLTEIAEAYRRAGLCALPARVQEKRPALSGWKAYQARLPTEDEIARWFGDVGGLCLICGAVSGNLEMLDFDLGGEAFPAWCEAVASENPDLLASLVIEQSPSGGRHVVYRSQSSVSGSLKLAQRRQTVDGAEEVTIAGKKYRPRQYAHGIWYVLLTLIETRGEGGLFLCAPSPGYELLQGDYANLPVLTVAERDLLLEAAWALNQCLPEPVAEPVATSTTADGRPGDDFNRRGDIRTLLRRHGWTLAKAGDNEYWRRPGKTSGWSATLNDNVFYIFSSSAAPFEPNCAYSPFAIFALLEHNGDYAAAAAALRREGFGQETTAAGDVDIFRLLCPIAAAREPGETDQLPEDPGPIPEELLRIPGFVSEVMDLCLDTAPYPNAAMAFCGSLALQAFLAGRKVRDPGDNRTNIYLLGLAHSDSGKDWPRKINVRIAHEVGLAHCLGDRVASGEGIQDALLLNPSLLFQTDEIDGMLQVINKAKDARYENIMGTLLTLYSSSNSVFPMRPKAGRQLPSAIDQPSLVLFGTAIPNHYYQALSERMLTNGFFARMIVLESGKRSEGQEPRIVALPSHIVTTARWWADFRPGTGNLENWHPIPAVVEHSDKARQALIETRQAADAEYAVAEQQGDVVGTTVWGRVSEQTRKLALLYAVSENHEAPRIEKAAVEWAAQVIVHQTRRMLFMAAQHVSDNPFEAECLKLIQKLREAPGGQLSHSVLLKRMKVDARHFRELIVTLQERGDVALATVTTAGRTGIMYRCEKR